jgi:4-hydroxy-tetrahydrodipicolinate reductase
MGRLVEALAPAHQLEVAGIVTSTSGPGAIAGGFGDVDVAIDFSLPAAVPVNLPALAARGVNVVIGTTGWQAQEAAMRKIVEAAGIGVLAAANFSLGMHVFTAAVTAAARRFAALPDVGAWIHEAHHAAKKDAPSGTALMLQRAVIAAGYGRPIDVSSTRAGSIPGTHTVGFDSATESVTLTHEVRDRAVFAHGALEAAKWLHGRRGWFTMNDMLHVPEAGNDNDDHDDKR